MTEADIKDQYLHSLGTITAIELVLEHRLSALTDPNVYSVREIMDSTLNEFKRGFIAQIIK